MRSRIQVSVADMRPLTAQDIARLIGSPIRREILLSLAEEGKDVSTLSRELDLDIRAISRFLLQLKVRRLVDAERVGRHHVYHLTELAQCRRENGAVFVKLSVSREICVEIERHGDALK